MSEKEGVAYQAEISQPIPQVSQQTTASVFAPQSIKQQVKLSREELLKEAQKILKQQPLQKPKSKQEVDRLLVDNYEVLLEIKKEYAKRKNANLFNSDLLNQIYEFEKNLIKLCRVAPPSIVYELEILKKNKSLVTAHSKMQKALLPLAQPKPVQQQPPPQPQQQVQQQQQQQYSAMASIPKMPNQQQPLQGQILPQQIPQQIMPQPKPQQQQQQQLPPHPQQILQQQQQQQQHVQGIIPHGQHNLGYQQQPQQQQQPHMNSQQHLAPNIPQQQVPYQQQQPPQQHPQVLQYQQQQPLPMQQPQQQVPPQQQQQQPLQGGIVPHHAMQQPQQQQQQQPHFQTY